MSKNYNTVSHSTDKKYILAKICKYNKIHVVYMYNKTNREHK